MNDEKFELTISDLAGSGTYYADIADELRARDNAQREALARVKADHEANGLEYGEALILIGQVLDCRSLEDLNEVRRYLNEFMDRYSLRPVPDVDLAQAEQQEAQGAQAGDELIRKVAVALARSPEITPDEARSVRAALATQPAAGEPVYQWRVPDGERWWTTSKSDYEWILENHPNFQARILWTAPPAAAHGDEAVRKDAEYFRFIDNCPIRTGVVLSRKAHEAGFDLRAECERVMAMRAQAGEGGE